MYICGIAEFISFPYFAGSFLKRQECDNIQHVFKYVSLC